MRFIYHHRTAGRGGEGVHIVSVIRALKNAGHEVELVSPPDVNPLEARDTTPLDKGGATAAGLTLLWKWVSCHCPQFLFELLEIGYNAYAVLALTPVFRRHRGAVFYERYAFFLVAGVALARAFGRKVILEVNEVAGVQRSRAQTLVGIARLFERFTFSRADEIVTVSSYLQAEVLRRGGRPGHVHVVPNAIDPQRFEGHDLDGGETRARLGLDRGATVIGFVGWFDKWDRLDRLIDLIVELRDPFPEVRLLLVGDGPVARDLSARVEASGLQGAVILSGPVKRPDVPSYIGAMDICVLPDSNEFGSPIAMFEFMAMGKAVAAPDLAPVRDVLVDGRTGVIFDRLEPRALHTALGRLISATPYRKRLGAAARQQVFERHTWDAVGAVVVSLADAAPAVRCDSSTVRVHS
jgi:glycosyltransferase involved in cell wall biosynthesis